MTYYPKRPVTSFQDLEVYQKLLNIAVVVVKRVPKDANIPLVKDLHEQILILPVSIGEAHSLRFGDTPRALKILEEIMVGCNKTIAYLELYRDLYSAASEVVEAKNEHSGVGEGTSDVRSIDLTNVGSGTLEFVEEQIKNIISTRFKVLHLQRSWTKFTPSGTKAGTPYEKSK